MPLSSSGGQYLTNYHIGGAIGEELENLAKHIVILINRVQGLELEKELLLAQLKRLEERIELPIFKVE